jgi:hypothetical protein
MVRVAAARQPFQRLLARKENFSSKMRRHRKVSA